MAKDKKPQKSFLEMTEELLEVSKAEAEKADKAEKVIIDLFETASVGFLENLNNELKKFFSKK